MAGIDKIYGTTEQYDEFYKWIMDIKPTWIKHFYPRDDYDDDEHRPITSFPTYIDMWLLDNCPIPFVLDAINFQYNLDRDINETVPSTIMYLLNKYGCRGSGITADRREIYIKVDNDLFITFTSKTPIEVTYKKPERVKHFEEVLEGHLKGR